MKQLQLPVNGRILQLANLDCASMFIYILDNCVLSLVNAGAGSETQEVENLIL